jgi:hypothetical protein
VAELVGIGDRLREAHDALLEGKGDAGVREATAERRRLVADLVDRAVAPLGGSGEAQREAISHTLDAAVAIPEAGIEVRAGRLQRELEAPSGFGGELVFGAGSGGDRVSGTDTASRRRSSIRKGGNRPGTKDKAADEAARREADERRKRVAELKRAASDAAKELKAAEADLASADEQLARAQQRRETTERRVEAAKKAVDAAAEALGELDES